MKLGAFIVPTGIGASIGGFAGDASYWARKFAEINQLIVNPNVVNAGGFSGITHNMLYVEGYSLDSFFKGEITLKKSRNNKIGVVFDKSIPKDVLNVHINTINAVKTVYGVDIIGYEVTSDEVGVEFFITDLGPSVGKVKNIETLKNAAQKLLAQGAAAIALVCMFDDPEEDNIDYANGLGVDPVDVVYVRVLWMASGLDRRWCLGVEYLLHDGYLGVVPGRAYVAGYRRYGAYLGYGGRRERVDLRAYERGVARRQVVEQGDRRWL